MSSTQTRLRVTEVKALNPFLLFLVSKKLPESICPLNYPKALSLNWRFFFLKTGYLFGVSPGMNFSNSEILVTKCLSLARDCFLRGRIPFSLDSTSVWKRESFFILRLSGSLQKKCSFCWKNPTLPSVRKKTSFLCGSLWWKI